MYVQCFDLVSIVLHYYRITIMLYAPIVSTSVVLMIVITRRMETRPHFNFRFFFYVA